MGGSFMSLSVLPAYAFRLGYGGIQQPRWDGVQKTLRLMSWHMLDGGFGPALVGSKFRDKWRLASPRDLLEYILSTL
jgi:hypothetical protein